MVAQYVTELAYPEMKMMANRKTIRWNFIKSLEPPRVSFGAQQSLNIIINRWCKPGVLRWPARTTYLGSSQCGCTPNRHWLCMTGKLEQDEAATVLQLILLQGLVVSYMGVRLWPKMF